MSIWRDAYGHPIEWRGPTDHRYPGGLVGGSRGLVVHIASGFFEGTIAWQKNATAASPTSSHWIVARDGRVAQMLDTADASWAQSSGNSTWHSVECEGFGSDDPLHATHPGWERLTDAQITAVAALYAKGHAELGWPLQLASTPTGRGLGHHSMGAPAWGHAACPGAPIIAQKQAILDWAKAPNQGGDMALRDDPDGLFMFHRIYSIAWLDKVLGGPEAGREPAVVAALKEIRANAALAATRPGVELTDGQLQALADKLAAQMPQLPTAAAVAAELIKQLGNG